MEWTLLQSAGVLAELHGSGDHARQFAVHLETTDGRLQLEGLLATLHAGFLVSHRPLPPAAADQGKEDMGNEEDAGDEEDMMDEQEDEEEDEEAPAADQDEEDGHRHAPGGQGGKVGLAMVGERPSPSTGATASLPSTSIVASPRAWGVRPWRGKRGGKRGEAARRGVPAWRIERARVAGGHAGQKHGGLIATLPPTPTAGPQGEEVPRNHFYVVLRDRATSQAHVYSRWYGGAAPAVLEAANAEALWHGWASMEEAQEYCRSAGWPVPIAVAG